MDSLDWEQLGVTGTIVGAIVTAATVYLQLYVRNQLLELQKEIHTSIVKTFMPRETINARLLSIEDRLDHIEVKLEIAPSPSKTKRDVV